IIRVYCVDNRRDFLCLRSWLMAFHLQSTHAARPERHVRRPGNGLDARNSGHALANLFAECFDLLIQSAGSLGVCTMQAPPFLDQWVAEHPTMRIARWHCAWNSEEDENL